MELVFWITMMQFKIIGCEIEIWKIQNDTGKSNRLVKNRDTFDALPILFKCDAIGGHWNWNWKARSQIPMGARTPRGWALRPLCILPTAERAMNGYEQSETDWTAEREEGKSRALCDENYSKHFSTVYSRVTRTHIHIYKLCWSNCVIDIHISPFLCIHPNVLNLPVPPFILILLLCLCAAVICILALVTWKAVGECNAAEETGKTKGSVEGWRSGGRQEERCSFVSTVTPTMHQHQCDTENTVLSAMETFNTESYSRFSLNFFC